MKHVPAMTFEQARESVVHEVSAARKLPPQERVPLDECIGRVLAARVTADRDYPPRARSIRDGYAVRAADFPGTVRVIGEVRAGTEAACHVGPGEAVEIMTGALLPPGADAVLMVEHAMQDGLTMASNRDVQPGEFVLPRGAECSRRDVVAAQGVTLDYTHVAMLAAFGWTHVPVFARPRVAILATGDELVRVNDTPADHQVRNSNAHSLSAQVRRAGGAPEILPVARDNVDSTRDLVSYGLTFDLLLLSGGVSAGKYDVVEEVLAYFGATFFSDRVLIQPGQPLVFGRAGQTFLFGLPGNPASTMITFELFARSALELLSGRDQPASRFVYGRLTQGFRHKPGLTRFLPARFDRGEVTPLGWQGSSDVPAMTRADAYLVARDDREHWSSGEFIEVLLK